METTQDNTPQTSYTKEEIRELKQYYVEQARKMIPGIPPDYPDEKCLRVLRKHIKRMIKFLSLFATPENTSFKGVSHACQHYIACNDVTTQSRQRIFTSFREWLDLLNGVKREKCFIKQSLQIYRRQLRSLEHLKSCTFKSECQ